MKKANFEISETDLALWQTDVITQYSIIFTEGTYYICKYIALYLHKHSTNSLIFIIHLQRKYYIHVNKPQAGSANRPHSIILVQSKRV